MTVFAYSNADKEKDLELAQRAKDRLDQINKSPTREELAAIDRILIDQARQRLAAPAKEHMFFKKHVFCRD